MKLKRVITNVLFGSCVIIATQQANAERPARVTPDAGPAVSHSEYHSDDYYDKVKVKQVIPLDEMLDTFQIDCSRKKEQVIFLQGFRQSKLQMIGARFQSMITPAPVKIVKQDKYRELNHIGKGDVNWIIDQKLLKLKNNC